MLYGMNQHMPLVNHVKRVTYLVAPSFARSVIQSLDHPQPQLLPLLAFIDGNILNMAHHTQGADELAFDDKTAGANDYLVPITYHDQEVFPVPLRHPVVALVPLLEAELADAGEHTENVKVPAVVV